jgi:hypothetical protein
MIISLFGLQGRGANNNMIFVISLTGRWFFLADRHGAATDEPAA